MFCNKFKSGFIRGGQYSNKTKGVYFRPLYTYKPPLNTNLHCITDVMDTSRISLNESKWMEVVLLNTADKYYTYEFTNEFNIPQKKLSGHMRYEISLFRIFDYPLCEIVQKVEGKCFQEANMQFGYKKRVNNLKRNPEIRFLSQRPNKVLFCFIPRFIGVKRKNKVLYAMRLKFFINDTLIHEGGFVYKKMNSKEVKKRIVKGVKELNCTNEWGCFFQMIENYSSSFVSCDNKKVKKVKKIKKVKKMKKEIMNFPLDSEFEEAERFDNMFVNALADLEDVKIDENIVGTSLKMLDNDMYESLDEYKEYFGRINNRNMYVEDPQYVRNDFQTPERIQNICEEDKLKSNIEEDNLMNNSDLEMDLNNDYLNDGSLDEVKDLNFDFLEQNLEKSESESSFESFESEINSDLENDVFLDIQSDLNDHFTF